MNITTKANVGDTTYFLADNKTALIKYINIEVAEKTSQFGTMPDVTIYYTTSPSNKVYEKDIFITKQELLDSL
jgi:hypothetical protein